MSIHDTTKLCCGPFCAECVLVMEKADEKIVALTEALRVAVDMVNTRERLLMMHRVGRANERTLNAAEKAATAYNANPEIRRVRGEEVK